MLCIRQRQSVNSYIHAQGQKRNLGQIHSIVLDDFNYCVYNGNMKTIINIKADREIKEKAREIAEELGLSLSTVVNAQLKQFIRNRSIYFSAIPHMTKELEDLIGEVERDMKKGNNISKPLSSFDEVSEHLDSL